MVRLEVWFGVSGWKRITLRLGSTFIPVRLSVTRYIALILPGYPGPAKVILSFGPCYRMKSHESRTPKYMWLGGLGLS